MIALHDHITTKEHEAVSQDQEHHISQTQFAHDVAMKFVLIHMLNITDAQSPDLLLLNILVESCTEPFESKKS